MSDVKNRNMERRPGLIGIAKTIAKDVQKFGKEFQDYTTTMQSGDIGTGSYSHNLYDTLGHNVADALLGKTPFKSVGKKTLKDFAIGLDLPVSKDVSLGFDTKGINTPGGKFRDFKFSLTKKF